MFTALKNALGSNIKTFGGAIIAGAGFTVGAAVAGSTLEAISKGSAKMASYINKKADARKGQPTAAYVQSMP